MWLKCSLCSKNCFFSLLPAIFFEVAITQTPDNSNLFRSDFPWRFELSGLNCIWREQYYGWQLMQLRQHHISFCLCSLLINVMLTIHLFCCCFFFFLFHYSRTFYFRNMRCVLGKLNIVLVTLYFPCMGSNTYLKQARVKLEGFFPFQPFHLLRGIISVYCETVPITQSPSYLKF